MRSLTLANGAVRVEVEFPPKDAHAALALFGRPGVVMAVAAQHLVGHAQDHAGAHPVVQDTDAEGPLAVASMKGGPLARLAGMWCGTPAFQVWIRQVYDRHLGGDGHGCGDLDEEAVERMGPAGLARHAILVICDIDSRRELDHNPRAAKAFNLRIRIPFSRASE